MLNELGQVIGIVSMRALMGEGIGFAIPVDSAKAALPNLLQKKKVPRPYIGVKMATEPRSERSRRDAVTVELVLAGSPAEKAGISSGDEILEVDGRKISKFEDVQSCVRSAKV